MNIPAGRTPFVGPLSPRKAMPASTSPTSAYSNGPNNVYPPAPHHATHPGYSPVQSHHSGISHYAGSTGPYHHDKHASNDPLSSSNVTSADSSDDEGGPSELPTHGMIAPFVAIRGLADVAERVAEVSPAVFCALRFFFSVRLAWLMEFFLSLVFHFVPCTSNFLSG